MSTILDDYLGAGLIEHSTSPFASPLVVVLETQEGVCITVDYEKLDKISVLGQLPFPRVDAILNSLGKGGLFSLFHTTASFHQVTVDKHAVSLTPFCAPTQLFQQLRMPQGCNVSPDWFGKIIIEGNADLKRAEAYLDGAFGFDTDTASHIQDTCVLLQRLRHYDLKLSPSKAPVGTLDAGFLGHTISSAGVRPNATKAGALTSRPMPTNVQQLHSLLGGLSYYRKLLSNFSEDAAARYRSSLKQGVKFSFSRDMEAFVRGLACTTTG